MAQSNQHVHESAGSQFNSAGPPPHDRRGWWRWGAGHWALPADGGAYDRIIRRVCGAPPFSNRSIDRMRPCIAGVFIPPSFDRSTGRPCPSLRPRRAGAWMLVGGWWGPPGKGPGADARELHGWKGRSVNLGMSTCGEWKGEGWCMCVALVQKVGADLTIEVGGVGRV